MSRGQPIKQITKLATGIAGFDDIALGGLPKGRTTLVSGTAGSGKTVLAAQFLASGIAVGEHGVFVSFEESPEDIRHNMACFDWDIQRYEKEGSWSFVDASPEPLDETVVGGIYDLSGLIIRIRHAIEKVDAKRVVLDSLGAIFGQFTDSTLIRREMFRLASELRSSGVTALLTAERTKEYGDIARFGVEEFVHDNVMILRNALDGEKRRRTIEILKFRGAAHRKGEYPFTIQPDRAIVMMPQARFAPDNGEFTGGRITTGVPELDEMCEGGFFSDSIALVSGATGTGKTLTTTHFLRGGIASGQRALLFALEESHDQFFRNAARWGMDLEESERTGQIKFVHTYPEAANLEDHLLLMREEIEEFKPDRIAVDSLSAFERITSQKGFSEFLIGLTSFIKQTRTAALFTSTSPTLLGGTNVTEAHVSTLTDTIILLRYVEVLGEMRRGLTVLKMRGSNHERSILEYKIDSSGMHLGQPFRNVGGIIAGNPVTYLPDELARLQGLFLDGPSQDQ